MTQRVRLQLPSESGRLVRNPDRMELVDAPEQGGGVSQMLVEIAETLAELREENRTLKERVKALEIEVMTVREYRRIFQLGDI